MRVPWTHGNIHQVLIKTWYKLHPAGIIREIARDNLPLREVGGMTFFHITILGLKWENSQFFPICLSAINIHLLTFKFNILPCSVKKVMIFFRVDQICKYEVIWQPKITITTEQCIVEAYILDLYHSIFV